MAMISASTVAISSLTTSDRTLICPSKTTASSSRLSSLSCFQLHFPQHLRRSISSTSTRTTPRALPLIEARQQTFSNFDELIKNSDKPVLVDFYATWCGPCQLMVPIIEKASATLKDKVQIVKIDTEKYTSIADKYKIEALPTFILFKDGEQYDRFEGAMPVDKLIQRIESSLEAKQKQEL